VALLDLRTGQWKTLIPGASQAEFVETGHLLYQAGGALWAVGFDESTLDTVGDPVPVLDDITQGSTAASFAVARRGTLVYAPSAGAGDLRSLAWVDRQGNEDPIATPRRRYLQPRLSPDETRVAVAVNEGRGNQIWIWDFSLRTLTPMPSARTGAFVVWSRNSRYLIFNPLAGANVTNVSRRAADGTGATDLLTTGDRSQRPIDISPDGRLVLFEQQTPAFSYDLMMLSLDDPGISSGTGARTSPLLDSPADERNASIAPDGRWIAYESNKSGQFQVYVKPFPNVDDSEHQISTEGGRTPVWSPIGRELFFVNGSALLAVAVQTTPSFRAANPTRLFEAHSRILDGRLLGNSGRTFDVSPDGKRFLMLKDESGAAARQAARPNIVVVQNWFEELIALLPATR
jgi:serine/threonine-protein kinase